MIGHFDEAWFRRHFPNASRAAIEANVKLPDPKLKPKLERPLGRAVEGKEKGLGRIIVRFKGYRVRPLDPDNFAGGCKGLLDGLRHAHLISGDEPWRIILQTEQERVSSFSEERTEIEIEYP